MAPAPHNWRWKVVGLTAVAVAVPFFASEYFASERYDPGAPWYINAFNRYFWYEQLSGHGPRKPRVDEVALVTISPDSEPGSALGENRCTHRAFMAALVRKIASAGPRVIVIDKWYRTIPYGVCPPKHDGTQALMQAVRDVSSGTPVVFALKSYRAEDIDELCQSVPVKLKGNTVVLADHVPFDRDAPAGRVSFGLARLNEDARKIPLSWLAYDACSDVGQKPPAVQQTLSVAAVAADHHELRDYGLDDLQQKIQHPFTTMVGEASFHPVPAIRLLCSDPVGPNVNWQACGKKDGDKQALAFLAHKIIVIGEKANDMQDTPFGRMPGPVVQANYIASLLDERAFRPAPRWLPVTITVAWLAFLLWIFYGWKKDQPELAALLGIAFTVALVIIFDRVLITEVGAYADVVPPSILEIFGLYIARKTEILLEKHAPISP